MKQCGSLILAGKCPKCQKIHSIKIDRACSMRLCALCAMRRSRAIAAQGLQAMAWIDENAEEEWKPFLITLTQRNCPHGELKAEIGRLLEALARLRHRRAVARQMLGAARTIEITHNHRANTWHPHIHMIALMKVDGLEKSGLGEAQAWRDLWAECNDLDYQPIIDIRPLHDQSGAIYEVAKYCTKFNKLLDGISKKRAAELIAELDDAIYDRTLQVWSGIWRKARKALKQKDIDRMNEEELAEKAKQCPDCGDTLVHGFMQWSGLQYEGRPGNSRTDTIII